VSLALKHLAVALLVGGALMLGSASAAPAASADTPCWVRLLNDWYDGRIDNTYPIPCYREAIDHLPTDIQVYSSARDDIERALQAAIYKKNHPPTPTTTAATTKSPTTTSAAPTTTAAAHTTTAAPATTTSATVTVTTTAHTTPSTTAATTTTAAKTTTAAGPTGSAGGGGTPDQKPPKGKGPVASAARSVSPGGAHSFPLPLLVLGGLAVLLVLAGGVGLFVRRFHGNS